MSFQFEYLRLAGVAFCSIEAGCLRCYIYNDILGRI